MWKAIIAGTAALAIASTSLVYAQQAGRPGDGQRWQPSTEDMRAFGEAFTEWRDAQMERHG